MDLFVINRYIGEDELDKPQKEDLKQKLLLKISERKKKSETKNEPIEENEKVVEQEQEEKKENDVELAEKKEPKKKKLKRKLQDLLKEQFEGDDDSDEGDADKAKRKKLKLNDIKSVDGFTIIGVDEFTKKKKVRRVLPNWLANPSIIPVNLQNLTTTIKEIKNLDETLVNNLEKNGIAHFFPVQTQLIPWLIAENRKSLLYRLYRPRDVCVSAPTGSGKTLAFVLPIVQALKNRIRRKIRAIVVLPVQELAAQVFSVFQQYVENTDLKVFLLTGKNNIEDERKDLLYKHKLTGKQTLREIDIIVTTPGRLVEHLENTKEFCVDYLRYVVIDEADRVMEHQQNDWLYHLAKRFTPMTHLTLTTLEKSLKTCPPPQKLLFSATLSQDPEKLENLNLFQPRLFTSVVENNNNNNNNKNETIKNEETSKFVAKYTTPAELTEHTLITPIGNKPLACFLLLNGSGILETRPLRTLCFVNSQNSAHRLALVLNHLGEDDGIKVGEMSAALSGQDRKRILKEFTNGSIQVLVATDTLARGIDLPNVDLVISYDSAKHLETYIHRVGRTARAGQHGIAVTCLINRKSIKCFDRMIADAGKPKIEPLEFTEEHTNPIQEKYQQALETLACGIEKEHTEKIIKEKHLKRRTSNKIKKNTNKKIKKHIKRNDIKKD